ncbi:MAG: cytochrome c [Burkholderiales bacterium]
MKPWLKLGAFGVVGFVAIAAAALIVLGQLGERKMQRRIDLRVAPVAWRDDAASVARGRYVFNSRGCIECHGVNGAGKTFIEDANGMLVHAPNITPGEGNAVKAYTADDWTRTIRHGVKPDGRPAIVMPSEDYARFTDADLAALVAYVRQMPPVAAPGATVRFPLPVKALYAVGVVKDAAERIDHTLPPPPNAADAPTAQHGAYLANACTGCHGATLSGGKIPGAPPAWPAAANLTPGDDSAMARYATPQALAAMFRSGQRPDGQPVSSVMPFLALKEINDTDVQALFLHLKSVPARPAGQR